MGDLGCTSWQLAAAEAVVIVIVLGNIIIIAAVLVAAVGRALHDANVLVGACARTNGQQPQRARMSQRKAEAASVPRRGECA